MLRTSPRMGRPFQPTTSELVGPSTYIICDGDRRVNVVPFLSSAERKPEFVSKNNTDALLYNIDKPQHIIGGSTVRNKAPRLNGKRSKSALSQYPGPGHYFVKDPKCVRSLPLNVKNPFARGPDYLAECLPKIKIEPSKDKKPQCNFQKGRLNLSKVDYSIFGHTPSIPTGNGYMINEFGKLVPDESNKYSKDQLGPATYTIDKPTSCAHYRGCRWSCRTSNRKTVEACSGPGPAAYHYVPTKSMHEEINEEFREMRRLLTFLPRYCEAEMLKKCQENLPGPADYNVDYYNIKVKETASINPRPLICGADRFKVITSDSPPPNIYDIQPKRLRPCSTGCVKSCLQKGDRFSKKKCEVLPGPADYDIKSALIEKLESKKNKYAIFHPPFNVTAERSTLNMKEANSKPSPFEYYVSYCPVHCATKNLSSVFKSKCRRFKESCLPPMSHLQVVDAFNFANNHQSHTKSPKGFNQTAKKGDIKKPDKTPGPGDYDSEMEKCHTCKRGGYMIPKAERFKSSSTDSPGPTAYKIHPFITSSMNRAMRTHNLILTENLLKMKLKLSPQETRKEFEDSLKQKKMLSWFLRNNFKQ